MPDPGQLVLHDAATPALLDGRYRVTLTPTLASGSGAPAAGTFELVVGDPGVDPGVLALHPPANAEGAYADELPMVVLRRRTMPWERAGFGRAGTPWLTIVVTRDDGNAEASVAADGTLRCTDLATQTRLLARPDEVSLLSHVREVDVADTLLDAGDDDGWQAVVVANRLPLSAGRWRASLVSLDGRADLAGGSPTPPTLGLATLTSWTFTVTHAVGGFGAALASLTPSLFGAAPADAAVADARGAVTLATRDRSGEQGTARYRSPLTGALNAGAVPEAADAPPDSTSTAAFQLGRLLAMADDRLLRELAQARARQLRDAATASAPIAHLVPARPLVPLARALSAEPADAPPPLTPAQAVKAATVERWRAQAALPRADFPTAPRGPSRPSKA